MRQSKRTVNLVGLGVFIIRELKACDYSLHSVKSRPAKVGDKLTTRDFGTGTRGFAAAEDANMAVRVMLGTESSGPIGQTPRRLLYNEALSGAG